MAPGLRADPSARMTSVELNGWNPLRRALTANVFPFTASPNSSKFSLTSNEQCKQEGILAMSKCDIGVRELNPGIFQIRGLNGSSHSYVIKGHYMNVMIDSVRTRISLCWNAVFFTSGLK